jgi:hypothetical protein
MRSALLHSTRAPNTLASALLAGAWLAACQQAPFTNCLDDATPCEVSTDRIDSHGDTAAANTNNTTLTSAPQPVATNSNATSKTVVATVADSTVAGDTAAMEHPDSDGSVLIETADASIEGDGDDSADTNEPTPTVTYAIEAGVPQVSNGNGALTDASVDAPTPTSVIPNGDFMTGIDGWKVEQTGGRSPITMNDNGALCVESRGDVELTIGWPADAAQSVVLDGGRYELSFKVQGLEAEMNVKVGHAYEPYHALHEFEWKAESDAWVPQISAFTTRGDDATGLAFFVRLNRGSLCLDDISLTPMAD